MTARWAAALLLAAGLSGCSGGEILDELAGRKHCTPTGEGENLRPCGGGDCRVCNGIRTYSDNSGHLEHLCDCPRSCSCRCGH